LLSDPELEQLTSWPPEVAHSDLVEFVNLGVDDLRWIRSHSGAANRLGMVILSPPGRFQDVKNEG